MLDDYKDIHPFAYNFLKSIIKNNRCSHAYIIEANGTLDALDFSISFSKYLFCPYNYTNNIKCKNCNQCYQIDNKNFLELKIIEADGNLIKKNQIMSLEYEFKKKSILSNKKIYIINHAEKMNIQSSNTLLKFLEEPSDDIVAILITDNIFNLLPTIISRCQVITLNNKEQKSEYEKKYNKSKEDIDNKIKSCIDFIYYYERYGLDVFGKVNSYWNKNFKDKENIIIGYNILLDFYKSILNYKLGIEDNNFLENSDIIIEISKKNSISNICDKINIIDSAKKKIDINANSALILDKLLIDLERVK